MVAVSLRRDHRSWEIFFNSQPCHFLPRQLIFPPMSTMNISLPAALKAFVDTQVSKGAYGTSSEYVRELIRKDQERLHLRELLLAGAASAPAGPADASYFAGLREQALKAESRG